MSDLLIIFSVFCFLSHTLILDQVWRHDVTDWICVVQDEARVQKMTKRSNTLEEVNNNVKLLSEMLSHYDRDRSSDTDRELMKVRSEFIQCADRERLKRWHLSFYASGG